MKQSVSLITLGATDYERAKTFYAALGWTPALEIEETAFFQANGVGIAANLEGLGNAAAGTFLGATGFLALGVAGVGAAIAPIRATLPVPCEFGP